MHALVLLWVRRPSDVLWFPWQRAVEPCNISICRAKGAEWSKRHWFCVRHWFKTISYFPVRKRRDDVSVLPKWDSEMKSTGKIVKDEWSRRCIFNHTCFYFQSGKTNKKKRLCWRFLNSNQAFSFHFAVNVFVFVVKRYLTGGLNAFKMIYILFSIFIHSLPHMQHAGY